MKEKFILHSDFNSFYASVECYLHPEIAELPVAVVGDPEKRHGIVLAKNQLAKKYNIKTGETIWSAQKKCPQLYLVQPHFDEYLRFSQEGFRLYNSYTPFVEPFGLDECWLDITQPNMTIESATAFAEGLRERVKSEMGITVSIGVSFTKSFAKLASDLKKPDAVSVISRDNYKTVAWSLPCEELLFVGNSTKKRLNTHGIFTIGDVAQTPVELLDSILGKAGVMLYEYANGLDNSPVSEAVSSTIAKSIGNSTTTDHDLTNFDEVISVFYALADKVASRLRKSFAKGTIMQITVKNTSLATTEKRCKLQTPTDISSELAETAIKLFKENFNPTISSVRALGIHISGLVCADEPYQAGLFDDVEKRNKQSAVDKVADRLRGKFGYSILGRASSIEQELPGTPGFPKKEIIIEDED